MGTIVKRKNKNAEVYTVRVRLKNLPEITATFKELKEAERFIFEKEIWLTKDPLNYSKLGRKYLLKDLIKKFTVERLPILKPFGRIPKNFILVVRTNWRDLH